MGCFFSNARCPEKNVHNKVSMESRAAAAFSFFWAKSFNDGVDKPTDGLYTQTINKPTDGM